LYQYHFVTFFIFLVPTGYQKPCKYLWRRDGGGDSATAVGTNCSSVSRGF
jgi:hypothetical protein